MFGCEADLTTNEIEIPPKGLIFENFDTVPLFLGDKQDIKYFQLFFSSKSFEAKNGSKSL